MKEIQCATAPPHSQKGNDVIARSGTKICVARLSTAAHCMSAAKSGAGGSNASVGASVGGGDRHIWHISRKVAKLGGASARQRQFRRISRRERQIWRRSGRSARWPPRGAARRRSRLQGCSSSALRARGPRSARARCACGGGRRPIPRQRLSVRLSV